MVKWHTESIYDRVANLLDVRKGGDAMTDYESVMVLNGTINTIVAVCSLLLALLNFLDKK